MTKQGYRQVYRNQPQLNFNRTLNDDVTPDVPEFNSNAMDKENMIPLNDCNHCNNCSCGGHNHKHKHK